MNKICDHVVYNIFYGEFYCHIMVSLETINEKASRRDAKLLSTDRLIDNPTPCKQQLFFLLLPIASSTQIPHGLGLM